MLIDNTTEARLRVIDEAILSHCAPIVFFRDQSMSPDTIDRNGTVGLIDTGHRKLLVTCAHVWTEFQDFRDANHSAQLAVIFADGYGWPIRLDDSELVDINPEFDLAVFEARPRWDFGCKRFYKVGQWPIPQAGAGDAIAFLGFAGIGRQASTGVGHFAASPFGLSVSDASDRKLILDNSRKDRKLVDSDGIPVPPIRMGGMSGSPAYVLRGGPDIFQLAGFVQMGNTSEDAIFVTHASFLKPDGTLAL